MSPARVQTRSERLSVREGGVLTLAVVADTHSRPHPALGQHLSALRPDAILHAGDIGEPEVLSALGRVAPVLAVRGNVDSPACGAPDELTLELVQGERSRLRLLLVHYAVNGPRLRADVARRAKAEGASLVVCGHSHVPFIGEDRGLLVFNPGSCGPRRFSLPIVFGILALSPGGLRLSHVDCETGKEWSPPG